MTTKRIIIEQMDEENKQRPYSNFDSFTDGFSQGIALKGILLTAAILIFLLLLLVYSC